MVGSLPYAWEPESVAARLKYLRYRDPERLYDLYSSRYGDPFLTDANQFYTRFSDDLQAARERSWLGRFANYFNPGAASDLHLERLIGELAINAELQRMWDAHPNGMPPEALREWTFSGSRSQYRFEKQTAESMIEFTFDAAGVGFGIPGGRATVGRYVLREIPEAAFEPGVYRPMFRSSFVDIGTLENQAEMMARSHRLTAHPDAHAFARHGGAVTDGQLITRALTGIAPDGSTLAHGKIPPMSSAFHSDWLLIEADTFLRQHFLPIEMMNKPGEIVLPVSGDIGIDLGRGFRRVGSGSQHGLFGPPEFIPRLTGASAKYELNPTTGQWETITIYPDKK